MRESTTFQMHEQEMCQNQDYQVALVTETM